MSDRPILFSAAMVRALLAGRKTQTRRAIAAVPAAPKDGGYIDSYCSERKTADNPRGMSTAWCWWTPDNRMGRDFKVKCAPGDRLWVREAMTKFQTFGAIDSTCHYPADDTAVFGRGISPAWAPDGRAVWLWKRDKLPSIHMPRWASRLTLTVTDVRVQRLMEISEEDAEAEGVPACARRVVGLEGGCPSFVCGYRQLWQELHRPKQKPGVYTPEWKGPGSWASDPWVACYTFTVEQKNIDA